MRSVDEGSLPVLARLFFFFFFLSVCYKWTVEDTAFLS